jgi:hypothetical protein
MGVRKMSVESWERRPPACSIPFFRPALGPCCGRLLSMTRQSRLPCPPGAHAIERREA